MKTFGFSYSYIFEYHLAVYLNGGDCAEGVNDRLREHLQNVRGMPVCCADTGLRGVKELETDHLLWKIPTLL
ncbi:hypothetical protein [Cyclobacterium roseum]|uniref:hypothetical protein n=1 Tax=Cyclobacterium roseum TaxID=2666137 RepID=UPI001390A58E|nr:hypothetical protein [Cyclobacterium roseum]